MDLKNFKLMPFYDLDKKWAILTSGDKEKFNQMTVSWGGFGTIWNKPVVTVYVRHNRYTYEFIENNEYFTLSFFSDEYKKDLSILGSKSGKDINKLSLTNLNVEYNENFVTYKEAVLTIICKKLYGQDLNMDNMSEEIKEKHYSNDPVHKMYIGEVIDIIDRR